ncbi:unnamed protein product [Acanthoscelides obtectus]|uniref:Uncharacterized protein n=1 Tax=Acanthoscelides obtectus TaxID=200917 RepID=A0A9P0KFR5_ACAOB|nr:unnamed protein product [Acanthoscelides obtectus]CAK1668769.1 hypothetical protein AOBTE_LOCUS26597 [Acanthoscelides obtectus]
MQEVKNKIKNLKSTYSQELNKINDSKRSGAGLSNVYTSNIKWLKEMEEVFIHDLKRKTYENCRIQSLLSEIGIKDYREKSAPNNSRQRSSSVFSNFTDVSYTSNASTDHVTNRFDDLTSDSDTLRTTNDIITLAMTAACDSDIGNEQV